MKITAKQKGETTILCIKGNVAERDIPIFESTMTATLGKSNKVIVSMVGIRSAETAEWPIANALCQFADTAKQQNKNVAIAGLPSEILCKANQLKLGARVRIFSKANSAITFLTDVAA